MPNGAAMAFIWAVFILGKSMPLAVLSNSNKLLAFMVAGLLPSFTWANNEKEERKHEMNTSFNFINVVIVYSKLMFFYQK